MYKLWAVALLSVGLLSCQKSADAQSASSEQKRVSEQKNLIIEGSQMDRDERIKTLNDGLYAVISTTRGDIWVELFYEQAPLTVVNFAGLAMGSLSKANKSGAFYDGLTFHRVIDNFMIQGGDPTASGSGGPGYRFADEIVEGLTFNRAGLLAMANAGAGTNGSQFFITHVPTPHLNGKHTIFGQVVADIDQQVVNAIKQNDRIETVTILRKGDKAQAFVIDQANFDAIDLDYKTKERATQEKANASMIAEIKKQYPNIQVSELGVYYIIEKAGSGERPNRGQVVSMHYDGVLFPSGSRFDSSYQRNEPIEVPAGDGYVIAGWDEMMLQMQVGEKRIVILPPELAYGAAGRPPVIPPSAWLQFTMERVS
ncbi:peptidylprolyl isomerase [Entomospira culicis]|nr:peptidylprolyl isomerase [Entomospira culicis]WDI37255.1 peptidylprolyl isomerase [Entomospira culicis]WDI38884.1 peptidylprolyl isomerase [Entomospira culicis]